MEKVVFILLGTLLLTSTNSFAICTSQELRDLKAANFTKDEIELICPICEPQDYIKAAQADKAKEDIKKICSSRSERDQFMKELGHSKGEVDMTPLTLLVGKAFTIGFDAYHSSKALRENDDEGLSRSKSGEDLFKAYIKYTLPVSSMTYAFNNNRPEKPHPLLKAFKAYAEGSFTNTASSDNGSTGLSIKTDNTLFYNVGLKFESDFQTLFSTGENYKYYSNY